MPMGYTYTNNISKNQQNNVYTDRASKQTESNIKDIFRNTKDFKDVTDYNLLRGVPDFGNLVQFNPYETGYAAFIICGIPKFIEVLTKYNQNYAKLVANWKHIIEYEFKSFDGLQDMSAETMELGDDLNKINVINKVNMEAASEFSLNYEEKSGSPLTKFAKLYLTGIKDPRTQVKTYHGLIHNGILEPGFENEVFSFLFITTDNTMREVENATLIIAGQLMNADTSMYEYTKGDINKKEITVRFNGYAIQSSTIDNYAQKCITYLLSDSAGEKKIEVNSMEYDYTNSVKVIEDLYNNEWHAEPELKNETTQPAAAIAVSSLFA